MGTWLRQWEFKFQPIATIFAVIGVFILCWLGIWQLERRAWKLDLIDQVQRRANQDPIWLQKALLKRDQNEDQRYQAIKVSGVYDYNNQAFVFGTLGPIPGYYVFTPLYAQSFNDKPAEGLKIFYVNRGFVPEEVRKKEGDKLGAGPEERVIVTGLFREAEKPSGVAKFFALINQPNDNIWYRRDPTEFGPYKEGKFKTNNLYFDWYIDRSASKNLDEYPRGGTTKIDFNNRHLGYAFTWFGLAMTLVGVWLAFSMRKRNASESTN